MKVEMKSVVDIDLPLLAKLFANLTDDEQAQFFIEAAKHFEAFGPGKAEYQAWLIGRHLRNCDCSTNEARDLISNIAGGLTQVEVAA